MEKIFIGNCTLVLAKPKRARKWVKKQRKKNKNFALLNFSEGEINISLDFLQEAVKGVSLAVIICKPVSKLREEFFKKYGLVEAAGGLVLNEKREVLMIYRRGAWDLPKGKRDQGEKFRATALREVKEETDLKNLGITSPIKFGRRNEKFTYHLYSMNGAQIMKATKWYRMHTTDSILHPQEEEDIIEARWVAQKDLKNYLSGTYPLVREVLKEGLK